jgi:hypothetical protein
MRSISRVADLLSSRTVTVVDTLSAAGRTSLFFGSLLRLTGRRDAHTHSWRDGMAGREIAEQPAARGKDVTCLRCGESELFHAA